MTIEQKAKAYDKAIEKIKYVVEHGVSPVLNKEDLEDIFSELKESEDERIRKAIAYCIMQGFIGYGEIENVTVDACLAWLEKQGQKPQVITNSEDERIREAQLDYWRSVGGKEWHGVPVQETIAWLEKQGEQKSTNDNSKQLDNKVEPKFKVGDWIINKSHDICLITDIDLENSYYICESNRFGNTDGDIDLTDKAFHLWTIQDAKDGDVLISHNNQPFIYNGNFDSFHVGAHCGITISGAFVILSTPCDWTGHKNLHPATKEQRELLFSEIKEAGYEWDEEKKELKKIEKQSEQNSPILSNSSNIGKDLQVDGFDAELNALLKKYEHLPKEEILGWLNYYVLVLGKEMEQQ